jgi:hypothetical protein
MAIVNMNAFYTVLRKAEKTLSLLPSKCESLNTLSLKSKINYLNRDSAKLRKELTRADKRLKDKDSFISKLQREIGSLKEANQRLSTGNANLKRVVERKDQSFLELRLSHTLSLKSKDDNFTAYKQKMEEKLKNCVSNYEMKLVKKNDHFLEQIARKDDYIDKLKSNRSENASDSVGRAPPTESDYESEEVWLPAQKCAVYPAQGWLQCKNKTCGHRSAPVRTRQKSNRLKKKGGRQSNINSRAAWLEREKREARASKKEYLEAGRRRDEYDAQRGEYLRLSMGYSKDPEKAYADLIALSNKMSGIEDPQPKVQKGVGSTSWKMADVD